MKTLEERLHQLVTDACKHQPGSAERQKYLTQIIRLVSKKLWKENSAYYQDALQQTWVYFCQNICEGNTGKPYDPTRGSVVTWLNFYLKRRLQDFYIDTTQQQGKTVSSQPKCFGDSEVIDPIENLPASPDVPPLLKNVQNWAENSTDPDLDRVHISDRPDVTVRVLILRRLPPETSWKDLSKEFNLSISTLSRFYQRQCLPRLRKFGESEGYI
jgi:hypothetical protein